MVVGIFHVVPCALCGARDVSCGFARTACTRVVSVGFVWPA